MSGTRWLVLWLGISGAGALSAHPLAPALLELRETTTGEYQVLWRSSTQRTQLQDVAPTLPESCVTAGAPPAFGLEGAAVSLRWTVRCDAGLVGQTLRFTGLERSAINVILRIQPLGGAASEVLLDARRPDYTVPPPAAPGSSFLRYFNLGVEHLLTGFDHLLFVAGLLLLVAGWRRLVLTVTAFTLGHSVTLALAALGYVQVNSALAELGIAASLLLLAVELAKKGDARLFSQKSGDAHHFPDGSLTERSGSMKSGVRPHFSWMAAAFGLLHGLGFAGALSEIGLPAGAIVPALLGFNLGIEAGQLAVIGALILVKMATDTLFPEAANRRLVLWQEKGVSSHFLAVYAMGTLAAWWCFQRAQVFLS